MKKRYKRQKLNTALKFSLALIALFLLVFIVTAGDVIVQAGDLFVQGKLGIGTETPAEKLEIADGNAKIGLATIMGDGTISTGLNSDKLDDYDAEELMAQAGGGSGCDGGMCKELPVGYYIGFDWDEDGKTMLNGDCDENCKDCWKGSTAWTLTPDGHDQNCDGTVDTPSGGSTPYSKTCSFSGWPVTNGNVASSCNAYCLSLGYSYVSSSVATSQTCPGDGPPCGSGNIRSWGNCDNQCCHPWDAYCTGYPACSVSYANTYKSATCNCLIPDRYY